MSSNNSRWIESRGTKLGQDKGRIKNWLEKTERKKIKTRKIYSTNKTRQKWRMIKKLMTWRRVKRSKNLLVRVGRLKKSRYKRIKKKDQTTEDKANKRKMDKKMEQKRSLETNGKILL